MNRKYFSNITPKLDHCLSQQYLNPVQMLVHDMYDSLPLDEMLVSERISLFESVILEQSFYIFDCVIMCIRVF